MGTDGESSVIVALKMILLFRVVTRDGLMTWLKPRKKRKIRTSYVDVSERDGIVRI